MALSDDELLDFDMKRLGGLERAPRRLLEELGDAYRYQLIAARWIQQRADSTESRSDVTEADQHFFNGYEQALREVIAHLRQGDFLPGGQVYEAEQRGRLESEES
jgi:hypothetical protein